MKPNHTVIYISDIQQITGLSEKGAKALIEKIKKTYGKKLTPLITLAEFCEYTGLKEKVVKPFLKK